MRFPSPLQTSSLPEPELVSPSMFKCSGNRDRNAAAKQAGGVARLWFKTASGFLKFPICQCAEIAYTCNL